jgi:Anti-sigma-K factor rskA
VTGPEFNDLIGRDVPAGEREQLLRAHEALLTAGPPAELPPGLEHAPDPEPKVTFLPKRRRYTAIAVAAAIALVALAGGYAFGQNRAGGGFRTAFVAQLEGPGTASGEIEVGNVDSAGNWPMILSVDGLKRLPAGGYYELLLTRAGKPVASCGTFVVDSNGTRVRLNAPYKLKTFDGWVVARHVNGVPGEPVVLRTSRV